VLAEDFLGRHFQNRSCFANFKVHVRVNLASEVETLALTNLLRNLNLESVIWKKIIALFRNWAGPLWVCGNLENLAKGLFFLNVFSLFRFLEKN